MMTDRRLTMKASCPVISTVGRYEDCAPAELFRPVIVLSLHPQHIGCSAPLAK